MDVFNRQVGSLALQMIRRMQYYVQSCIQVPDIYNAFEPEKHP